MGASFSPLPQLLPGDESFLGNSLFSPRGVEEKGSGIKEHQANVVIQTNQPTIPIIKPFPAWSDTQVGSSISSTSISILKNALKLVVNPQVGSLNQKVSILAKLLVEQELAIRNSEEAIDPVSLVEKVVSFIKTQGVWTHEIGERARVASEALINRGRAPKDLLAVLNKVYDHAIASYRDFRLSSTSEISPINRISELVKVFEDPNYSKDLKKVLHVILGENRKEILIHLKKWKLPNNELEFFKDIEAYASTQLFYQKLKKKLKFEFSQSEMVKHFVLQVNGLNLYTTATRTEINKKDIAESYFPGSQKAPKSFRIGDLPFVIKPQWGTQTRENVKNFFNAFINRIYQEGFRPMPKVQKYAEESSEQFAFKEESLDQLAVEKYADQLTEAYFSSVRVEDTQREDHTFEALLRFLARGSKIRWKKAKDELKKKCLFFQGNRISVLLGDSFLEMDPKNRVMVRRHKYQTFDEKKNLQADWELQATIEPARSTFDEQVIITIPKYKIHDRK